MTNTHTDAALAEVQRTIVNLGDTTTGGIFDRMTLTACAQIAGQMRKDIAKEADVTEPMTESVPLGEDDYDPNYENVEDHFFVPDFRPDRCVRCGWAKSDRSHVATLTSETGRG